MAALNAAFACVRVALWSHGPAAMNGHDRAVLDRLGFVPTDRQPHIPDLLVLDPQLQLLDRVWPFAPAEELLLRLQAVLPQPVPVPEPDERRLQEADALAHRGDWDAARRIWREVSAMDHPHAHRARLNLMNRDIWPIPSHPALKEAPPPVPSDEVVVWEPERRERALQALRQDAEVRWLGELPFVRIPEGRFEMGVRTPRFPREGPAREVTLTRPYWMAAWPIPRGVWGDADRPEAPRLGLSWTEAVQGLQRLSTRHGVRLRLPTEAEWERAARGGVDGQPFPWGDAPPSPQNCNVHREEPVAVGCYPPNAYGLFDLLGNGLEWCQDAWNPDALHHLPSVDPVCLESAPEHRGLRSQRSMFCAPRDLVWQLTATACRTYGLQDQSFGGRGVRPVFWA